jgi:hypothetical protein
VADEVFERRLNCAVRAGWWTVVVAVLWMMVGWVVWLVILGDERVGAFVAALWGGVDLDRMRLLVAVFFGMMKVALFALLLGVIFLTVWSRKLRGSA